VRNTSKAWVACLRVESCLSKEGDSNTWKVFAKGAWVLSVVPVRW
jgi:hypothetical protein